MRAVQATQKGGPEVLSLSTVPEPRPQPGEVLVQVKAAGVNFIDTYHRTGLYPLDFPVILGMEGSGVVEELGDDVAGMQPGDRVAWCGQLGSYAEKVAVPAAALSTVPEEVDHEQAAALVLQGMTAHLLVTDTFPLGSNHRCLIHAGAGGVGGLLIQMAKMRGATVFTTVGSSEKADVAREAGADHVINYEEQDFVEEIESMVGPRALDVVYDGVGAVTFSKGLGLLRPMGMMVTYGNSSGPPPEMSPLDLRDGSLFLTRPMLYDYIASREDLERRAADVFDWVRAGKLTVRIGSRLPLEAAAEAHRALEGRATIGKVLLIP